MKDIQERYKAYIIYKGYSTVARMLSKSKSNLHRRANDEESNIPEKHFSAIATMIESDRNYLEWIHTGNR